MRLSLMVLQHILSRKPEPTMHTRVLFLLMLQLHMSDEVGFLMKASAAQFTSGSLGAAVDVIHVSFLVVSSAKQLLAVFALKHGLLLPSALPRRRWRRRWRRGRGRGRRRGRSATRPTLRLHRVMSPQLLSGLCSLRVARHVMRRA